MSIFTNANTNPLTAASEEYKKYQGWLKSIETVTLRSVLAEAGIEIATSPGGYPALVANNGATDGIVNLPQNAFSAINAIADLPKYRVLEFGEQVAWFDPRVFQSDVRVLWDASLGLYQFYNWKNYTWTKSSLSYKPKQAEDNEKRWAKRNHIQAVVNKHNALDTLVSARYFGIRWMAVASSEALVQHLEKKVLARIDLPYTEVRRLQAEDIVQAQGQYGLRVAARQEANTNHAPNTDIIKQIEAIGGRARVGYTNPIMGKKVMWLTIDLGNEADRARIEKAQNVEWVKVQAVDN